MKNVINKGIATVLIAMLAFCVSSAVYHNVKADQSQGIESAWHESKATQFEVITFVMIAIPAITSVRIGTSLGFKSLVARTDEAGNTVYLTYLQDFLRNYLSKFGNEQTKQAISEGKVFFDPITYYIRFVITALAGKTKILGETTIKTVGATNFNGGYLPKFTNFAWNKIGVAYCDDATSGSVAAKDLIGLTSVRASVDKSVANGELIISSARNVIFENPIAPFLVGALSTAGAIGEMDYELDQPRVLKENELIEMEVNLANTVPSTSAHTFGIEVRLTGVQVRLRG